MISARMFPAEEIPETIGTYRIVRRLAPVGPAEVYLARTEGPLGFQRECELKLLPDTSEGNAEFAEDLAREAAITSKLNNQTVVRLFDFFEHNGKLVLVMEHVEGTTLVELMAWLAEKKQKLSDAAALYIGTKIAGALADAHAAKDEQGNPTPIIHRNLTPENVLVALDGDVRLTGFSVGKILGRTPDTAIGRIKGTPGFMAPEQARGEPVTTKADVYGLGLLLWSLLGWKRPPTDGSWPRRISGMRNDLPREVAAVVDAALDHFPGTRKITAKEIERWLGGSASIAKGKAELKERVAQIRNEQGLTDRESALPPPSGPTKGAFQGVSFGTPGEPARTTAARRDREPPSSGRSGPGTALSKVVLNLPPPPPPEAATDAAPATPPPAAAAPATPMPPIPVPASARASMPSAPRFGEPAPATAPLQLDDPQPAAAPVPAPATLPPAAPSPHPPQAAPPPDGRVVPKPSILPSPASPSVGARPTVPRSSLLGIAPPSPEMLAAEEQKKHAPPPSLKGPDTVPPRARQPMGWLSTTVAVSAVTAACVAVSLYLLVFRGTSGGTTTPQAATASATVAATTPPPPTATAVVPASTTTAAPSADAAPAASVNPADLPYGFGYLYVASPATANVYLSGKIAGPVNTPLKVRCGRFFVRLAAPPESRYPEWVSPGTTVVVACQELTRLDLGAKP
jgi:serine/threonine-protein kinase